MWTRSSDHRRSPYRRHSLVGIVLATVACDGATCVQKPCPLPTAIMAVVTSSTGAPLAGLFVDVSTPVAARIPCDQTSGRCVVSGNSGSYTLSFGATGYQTVQRTVSVTAVKAAQACGCDAVTTQQLQLMLVPL